MPTGPEVTEARASYLLSIRVTTFIGVQLEEPFTRPSTAASRQGQILVGGGPTRGACFGRWLGFGPGWTCRATHPRSAVGAVGAVRPGRPGRALRALGAAQVPSQRHDGAACATEAEDRAYRDHSRPESNSPHARRMA